MQNNTITPTDMVIKVAELMVLFQKYERTEENILKTLYSLLDLVNILDDVRTTFYVHDSKESIVIPSKNMPQSNKLNENAQEIIDTWIKFKEENNDLSFISLQKLIAKSEKLSSIFFDNININRSFVAEAAGQKNEYDLFIIEKNSDNALSEYEKDYLKKISLCAKSINENVYSGTKHIQNEKILTQVLDNIDAMIYVSDLETEEVLFVNDRMKKAFGLNDVKHNICWKIFQQDFTETCEFCPVHKLKSVEDEPIVWEEHNTVTNQYYQNTDRLINWIDGRVVHIQHSVDITDIKKTEENLKQALEVAEKNAQAKSEFLSKMSHELRTPLNAIIGMISIIEKTNDIEKINDFINKMKSASNNLLQTINDILDISKIDAGKIELMESEFNIEDMFRDIFDIVEYGAHDKDITIESNIETTKNCFIGDSKRLGQVYMNLLSNAVKFTGKGGRIVISVKYNKLPNGLIKIVSTVKDNGVGIPEDKIDTLFQSFTQVDNRLARQYTGTGLGLFIAKSIVELMGGKISVESKLGEGSTFTFNLMLKESESHSKTETLSESFNILIIDDCDETCEYLNALFQTRSIKHKIAKSGEEGLALINSEQEAFNVILVDYMMPTMNGLETVKKLRTIVNPETIIIMISSIDWSMIEEEANEVGVNHFLPKPLLPSDIINAINEIFQKKEIKHVENDSEKFDFTGKTILLFEDVDINREITQLLLEDTGAKVIEAEDGIVGVKLYNENPEKYDLILMDIQMPNMDGFEATKLIRESGQPNAKTIPIVAMTANVFAEQIQDTLSAGMNSHLGKPIDEIEMKKELKKWLK